MLSGRETPTTKRISQKHCCDTSLLSEETRFWFDLRYCQDVKPQTDKQTHVEGLVTSHTAVSCRDACARRSCHRARDRWSRPEARFTNIIPGIHPTTVVGWFLEFYILATYKVISGWVLTFESSHSWWLYSVAALGNWHDIHPTQSGYPDTESTSPWTILIVNG